MILSATKSRELALAKLWSMPVACGDVVFEKKANVLLGFRAIPPYRGVWALPGGRIRKHEHPQDTAKRVLKEIRILADPKESVEALPVRFPRAIVVLTEAVSYSRYLLPAYVLAGCGVYLLTMRALHAFTSSDVGLVRAFVGKRWAPLIDRLARVIVAKAS